MASKMREVIHDGSKPPKLKFIATINDIKPRVSKDRSDHTFRVASPTLMSDLQWGGMTGKCWMIMAIAIC